MTLPRLYDADRIGKRVREHHRSTLFAHAANYALEEGADVDMALEIADFICTHWAKKNGEVAAHLSTPVSSGDTANEKHFQEAGPFHDSAIDSGIGEGVERFQKDKKAEKTEPRMAVPAESDIKELANLFGGHAQADRMFVPDGRGKFYQVRVVNLTDNEKIKAQPKTDERIVVIDDREGDSFSGHDVWYRYGAGDFDLKEATPADGPADLLDLMTKEHERKLASMDDPMKVPPPDEHDEIDRMAKEYWAQNGSAVHYEKPATDNPKVEALVAEVAKLSEIAARPAPPHVINLTTPAVLPASIADDRIVELLTDIKSSLSRPQPTPIVNVTETPTRKKVQTIIYLDEAKEKIGSVVTTEE